MAGVSAAVILVDPAGRILLQRRDDKPEIAYPAHWGITGGYSNPGESPEETALREVEEETGIRLQTLTPFRVYPPDGASHETTHYYYACCDVRLEAMQPTEGQGLAFFAPDDLTEIPLAYNHAQVLADFVASPAYTECLEEASHAGDPARFCEAVRSGREWFGALMDTIAHWRLPDETVGDRHYQYLINNEAFDWLLLAGRLLDDCDSVPAAEKEALLFEGRAPIDLRPEDLKRLMGTPKYRAYLNYLYGVVVEEALQLAVEEEVHKERHCHPYTHRGPACEAVAFERLYGKPRPELLAEFGQTRGRAAIDEMCVEEMKAFTYWLFKYRMHALEPARVASDTRKALAQLSSMTDASRRRRSARKRPSGVQVPLLPLQSGAE